jgi:putative FmdB family regulatory protein
MPTYDFRCLNCLKRFDVFLTYSDYEKAAVHCPRCGSEKIQRRIGRIRVAKSDSGRLEEMGDPSALDGIDKDPQSLGRMMRQMGSQIGEEMPPEFDEVVGRLESGETPDDIDRSMPDLGEDSGGTSEIE